MSEPEREELGEPAPRLREIPRTAPFTSVARRRRRASAFALGFVVGAGATWAIVLVATAMGRGMT